MHILFLSRWYPYPADNGSRIRIFNLLRGLAQQHTLTLISFTQQPVSEDQLAALRPFCQAIHTLPYRPFRPTRGKALLGYLSLHPRSVIDTYSQECADLVRQCASQERFDLVLASQIDMAPYALLVPQARKLLEELEVSTIYEQFARASNLRTRLRGALTWAKHARYVKQITRQFHGCTVVSASEKALIERVTNSQRPLWVIPNGVDAAACAGDYGPPTPDSLIYAGSLTYQPNYDAVSYFLAAMFPAILQERPATHLTVTGSSEGVPLERLPASNHWHLAGYLPDVRPTIARSWASIVPLRQGGGTRLKILESLALGTPVIATSKGAEGLDLRDGEEILLADEPAAFVKAVLRLLRDPALRQRLSQAGRAAVAARYDWSGISAELNRCIATL
jgi:polysaccharide biosynthesis protein PslH